MTNADRVRKMNNEELADIIFRSHCFMCEHYQKEQKTCNSPVGFMCSPSHIKGVIQKWLESEAEK